MNLHNCVCRCIIYRMQRLYFLHLAVHGIAPLDLYGAVQRHNVGLLCMNVAYVNVHIVLDARRICFAAEYAGRQSVSQSITSEESV